MELLTWFYFNEVYILLLERSSNLNTMNNNLPTLYSVYKFSQVFDNFKLKANGVSEQKDGIIGRLAILVAKQLVENM